MYLNIVCRLWLNQPSVFLYDPQERRQQQTDQDFPSGGEVRFLRPFNLQLSGRADQPLPTRIPGPVQPQTGRQASLPCIQAPTGTPVYQLIRTLTVCRCVTQNNQRISHTDFMTLYPIWNHFSFSFFKFCRISLMLIHFFPDLLSKNHELSRIDYFHPKNVAVCFYDLFVEYLHGIKMFPRIS